MGCTGLGHPDLFLFALIIVIAVVDMIDNTENKGNLAHLFVGSVFLAGTRFLFILLPRHNRAHLGFGVEDQLAADINGDMIELASVGEGSIVIVGHR